jgi:SAM-dependent methyltransferase
VPSPEQIASYFSTVEFADPKLEERVARDKEPIQRRLLKGLSPLGKGGELLDFGCNFGQFLCMARDAGWAPSGFEPYEVAADTARAKGFEVRGGWCLEAAGFERGRFAAVTMNDVLALVWHPYRELTEVFRVLADGGMLAMRVSNKRGVMGVVRALTREGDTRDRRISRLLQAQFHSARVSALCRTLREIGFTDVYTRTCAPTASWANSGWGTRLSYAGAAALFVLTLGRVDLSPGVLVFARKP